MASYLTSKTYTFPIYDNTIDVSAGVSKEVLLQASLRLDRLQPISPPIRTSHPINHTLNHQLPKKQDPLLDILYQSRNRIKEYSDSLHKERPIPPPINTNTIRISKRQERSTPTSNKTVYFSPSGKGKLSSTPITKRTTSMNLKQRLLKMDSALVVKDVSIHNDKDVSVHNDRDDHNGYNDEVDESDYDHLACHADNIMRMAVDSTMLGSTFNSFSSSFNSFVETGKDFLDKEAKKSILEGLNF